MKIFFILWEAKTSSNKLKKNYISRENFKVPSLIKFLIFFWRNRHTITIFFIIFVTNEIFKILFTKRKLIRYYYFINIYIVYWNMSFICLSIFPSIYICLYEIIKKILHKVKMLLLQVNFLMVCIIHKILVLLNMTTILKRFLGSAIEICFIKNQ